MTGLLLLAPLLMAFLPGLWSFGHMKRMFWTMMVFLFLPVLLMIPGGMLLEVFGMTWRCAAVVRITVFRRYCGVLSLGGGISLAGGPGGPLAWAGCLAVPAVHSGGGDRKSVV